MCAAQLQPRPQFAAQRGGKTLHAPLVRQPHAVDVPRKHAGLYKTAQRLLLKTAHGVGVQRKLPPVACQQVLRQHHAGDADARRKAFGEGRQIHDRPLRPRHALQAGQRAGRKAKLGIIVVLQNIPPRRGGRPLKQLRAARRGHRHAGGEVVARRDVAHVGPAGFQPGHRQPLAVNVHQAAGQAAVFQHDAAARVAGVFDGRHRPGQQVRQAAEQILDARADHDLLRRARHAAVGGQVRGDLHAQGAVALAFAALQKLRRLVQKLFLDAPPAARREQLGVDAAGGKVVPRLRRRGGGRGGRGRGGRAQHAAGFLYIKPAARPRPGQTFGRQHLVGCVHRVHAHAQLPGHCAAPGQRRSGGALPAADLLRQLAVQLFVQRHAAARFQFDHRRSLPLDKLAP